MAVGQRQYNIQSKSLSVKLLNAYGVTWDLTPHLQGITINEDIESNFITAELTVSGGSGISEQIGISGEEYVQITFSSHDDDVSRYGKIFKVDKVLNDPASRDAVSYLTIGLISAPAVTNFNTRVNRSFRNMTADLIVKHVLEKHLGMTVGGGNQGIFQLEKCKFPKNMVVPNWRPFKLINFLADNSVGIEGESCNILFYENKFGFNFRSFDHIINSDDEYVSALSILGTGDITLVKPETSGITGSQTAIGMNNAYSADISRKFDMSMNYQVGTFGSTCITYNALTKEIRSYSMTLEDQFSVSSLNSGPLFDPLSTPMNASNHITLSLGNDFYDSHDKCKFSPATRRAVSMGVMANQRFVTSAPGDSEYTVGIKLRVTAPSNYGEKGDDGELKYDDKNKLVTATYVVTKAQHIIIAGESYRCHLELMKDSYEGRPAVSKKLEVSF